MPQNVALDLMPIFPAWAVVAVGVVLILLLAYGSVMLRNKNVPAKWVGILGALRVVIVLLILVCLFQPIVSMTRTTQHLPDLIVMLDTSQSMAAKNGSTGNTRLEDAVAAVRGGKLGGTLEKQYNVHYFAFDRSAYPLEESDLTGLKATGDSTRFAESLSTAWDYQRQAGSLDESSGKVNATPVAPTRAIIVSDGGDLSGDDVVEAARKLGVVVDTLAPGATTATQAAEKVVIATVQSPQRVLLGSETQISVTLRADGAVKGPVTLTMSEAGKPVATREVEFTAGQPEKQVRLAQRPTGLGVKQYELTVKGAGITGAATPPYKFTIRVMDNRKEVVYLEDTWRWEFKYLRRVFEDDPSFSFTAFLPRGAGTFAQYGEADRKINLGGYPQTKSELEWFDMIVLGDVNPKKWSSTLAPAIARLVIEEGKSLVVIAGPNIGRIAESPELAPLLPVEVTRASSEPLEGPVPITLSREGASSPFFFNAPGGQLPPLDRIYPPLRKRPAATILVEAEKVNEYGKLIVMAEHTVGRGRVLFVGTDTLWKWQMAGTMNESNVTPYGVFWQQALRALAPAQSHTGGVSLTLQPDRSRYEAGRRVVLRAQMKSDRPIPDATIQSMVSLPDGKQVPLAFASDPAKPNSFRAEFETTTAGQYKIAAAVNTQGKAAADVLTAIDVEEPRAENSAAPIDNANLARIATATGGQKIDLNDPKTWPSSAEEERYPVTQAKSFDLWNNMTLMLVLCALLGADWLIRLLRGYV